MLLRILFWAIVIYLAYRIINTLVFGLPPKRKQEQVKGRPQNRPLDLSQFDVEDAKFEEIDEKKKNGK